MTKKIIFALIFSLFFSVPSFAVNKQNNKKNITVSKKIPKTNNLKNNQKLIDKINLITKIETVTVVETSTVIETITVKVIETITVTETITVKNLSPSPQTVSAPSPQTVSAPSPQTVSAPSPQTVSLQENKFNLVSKNDLENSEICKLNQQKDLRFIKSTGSISGIAIFIGFSNLPSTEIEKNEWINTQIPNFYKFISLSSYNKLNTNIEIFNSSLQLPNSTGYYGLDTEDHQNAKIHQLKDDILNISDQYIDFSKYDFISLVYPKTINNISGVVGGTERDGKSFSGVIVGSVGEYLNQDSKKYWLVHEFGHLLGLIHPYVPRTNIYFDIMGATTHPRPDFLSWTKYYLNWLSNDEINCLTLNKKSKNIYEIVPLLSNNLKTKSIIIKASDTTAYFLEYRSNSKLDYMDSEIAGIYLFKIDTTKGDNQGLIETIGIDISIFENNLFKIKILQQNESEIYLEIEVKNE